MALGGRRWRTCGRWGSPATGSSTNSLLQRFSLGQVLDLNQFNSCKNWHCFKPPLTSFNFSSTFSCSNFHWYCLPCSYCPFQSTISPSGSFSYSSPNPQLYISISISLSPPLLLQAHIILTLILNISYSPPSSRFISPFSEILNFNFNFEAQNFLFLLLQVDIPLFRKSSIF